MLEFKEQRDRDFMASCRRARRELMACRNDFHTPDIVRHAIASPAPAYYVGHKYALRMLSHYANGGLPSSTAGEKLMMWSEIALRVEQHLQRNRHHSTGEALAAVLTTGHAGRFFISEKYALRLYYRLSRDKSYRL